MAIFSKSTEQADNAVTKAQAAVTEWENKAAAARAEAARMDSESGAAILADETAAERLTLGIQSQERKARAFEQAASEARKKLITTRREALEAEARDEDKEWGALRKLAEAQGAKVEALQKQLEELDECEWERSSSRDVTGGVTGWPLGKSASLEHFAHRHATRAAVIRYFIATGQVPHDSFLLDKELGTSLISSASFASGDYVPDSVRAARDAGLVFVE